MAQEQLNRLALMAIENNVLNNLQFISKKLHKVIVWILIVVNLIKINLIFL